MYNQKLNFRERVLSSTTVLDSGQSRAFIFQAVQEGALRVSSNSDYFFREEISEKQKNKALSQLLTSDKLLLTLDGNTCEWNYSGDLIESGEIDFLEYGYDRKKEETLAPIFPDLASLISFLNANGMDLTVDSLLNLQESCLQLSREFEAAFSGRSTMELQIEDIVSSTVGSGGTLNESQRELIKRYSNCSAELGRIVSTVSSFELKIKLAQQNDYRLSLDLDVTAQSPPNFSNFIDPSNISKTISDGEDIQVVKMVCMELGTLPFRRSVLDTHKMKMSGEFKSLRQFSDDFLTNTEVMDEAKIELLMSEISYARKHLKYAKKAGEYSRFFTYAGIPLTLLTPIIPALGSVGIAATFFGAYATLHQHAREYKFAWAGIGAA